MNAFGIMPVSVRRRPLRVHVTKTYCRSNAPFYAVLVEDRSQDGRRTSHRRFVRIFPLVRTRHPT